MQISVQTSSRTNLNMTDFKKPVLLAGGLGETGILNTYVRKTEPLQLQCIGVNKDREPL